MAEMISGYRARDEYGLTVMDLAEACREGLLKAFSSFEEKQIYSAESCTVKHRYPVKRFTVNPQPSFIVEDILFNKKTLDDFYINFDNKFCNQDINNINRKVIEIKDNIFYLYKLKDLKDRLNNKNDELMVNLYDYKWLRIQNFLELKENIKHKHKFYIDVIYRGCMRRGFIDINDVFFHVKCCIEYNNKLYDDNVKIYGTFVEQVIDRISVKEYEKIHIDSYDILSSLWNNTYQYFYNNVELKYGDFFIFNYEMYKLYRKLYKDDDEKIKEKFQEKILSFLFRIDEIENFAHIKTKNTDKLIKENPKEYIIKIYSELLNKLKKESKKYSLDIIRIDMYIKKLQGKTNKEIIDNYNQVNKEEKDESYVSRYIGKDLKKIANKYKLPYIDWKNIIEVKTSNIKHYTNEELTKDIEEQLRRMQ